MKEVLQIKDGVVRCPLTDNGLPVRHNRDASDCLECAHCGGVGKGTITCTFIDSAEAAGYRLPKNL